MEQHEHNWQFICLQEHGTTADFICDCGWIKNVEIRHEMSTRCSYCKKKHTFSNGICTLCKPIKLFCTRLCEKEHKMKHKK